MWGRLFGERVSNQYLAFADPRATGGIAGLQAGFDIWRGSLGGGRDTAGLYVAYSNASIDATGLVTNPTATGYVLGHTGKLNLNAVSGAAYWTHVGPGGWYLDAVAQVTGYDGTASTLTTQLDTTGVGTLASLEGGLPIALPAFGPGFVLEPQAQIIWQRVQFDDAGDQFGAVALGTTSGMTGRIGVRGRWTMLTAGGQVWQPYLRANLWEDWGADAPAVYAGTDLVPLSERGRRLQLGGGVTARINTSTSLYANADYQFAIDDTDGGRRDSVRAAAGVRFIW